MKAISVAQVVKAVQDGKNVTYAGVKLIEGKGNKVRTGGNADYFFTPWLPAVKIS